MPSTTSLTARRRCASIVAPVPLAALTPTPTLRNPATAMHPVEEDGCSTTLMDRFRRTGDRSIFEDLVRRNAPMLRRMILARLRGGHGGVDANDVLQDTFFNIYRYPSRFRADRPAAFRIWASTIVRNTLHRHLRRSLRRELQIETTAESLLLSADPGPSPAQSLVERDEICAASGSFTLLLLAWASAYRELRDRDRRVLHLVEIEGRPYREAAELLGVRPGNLKMLVFRARRRIALRIGLAFEKAALAAG